MLWQTFGCILAGSSSKTFHSFAIDYFPLLLLISCFFLSPSSLLIHFLLEPFFSGFFRKVFSFGNGCWISFFLRSKEWGKKSIMNKTETCNCKTSLAAIRVKSVLVKINAHSIEGIQTFQPCHSDALCEHNSYEHKSERSDWTERRRKKKLNLNRKWEKYGHLFHFTMNMCLFCSKCAFYSN